MPRKTMWLGLLILSLSLSGCNFINKQDPNPSKVQEELINMKGYACLARISHLENGNSNTYETKQIYQMDGMYRFEVTNPEYSEGLTTIYNGEIIIQYNPKIEEPKVVELPANNFRNQIFLGTFVQNYLQSEEVAIEVQKIEGAMTTVLEAIIPGGSQHMSTQRLWIDQKTYKPTRMVIYNQEDKETVIVELMEFTYNPEINESVFRIK